MTIFSEILTKKIPSFFQPKKFPAFFIFRVASPFELRGTGNSDLGAIAASGVFLAEDGKLGTVQEVNLSV